MLEKIKSLLYDLIIILLSITALVSFGYTVKAILDYKQVSDTYTHIQNVYHSDEAISDTKTDNKFKKLKDINKDFIAWIRVDGTNIDYPVVKTDNNDYYLSKDFNKNKSVGGSLFIDCNNTSLDDKNVVIYGHYMKNKTLFNNIHKFKNEEFFNENRFFTLENEQGLYKYEIFSAYTTSSDDNYTEKVFVNDDDFEHFIFNLKKKSKFIADVDVSKNDKIVTLSTCSYEIRDGRMAVHGKLVNFDAK